METRRSRIESFDWRVDRHGRITPVVMIAPVEFENQWVDRVLFPHMAAVEGLGLAVGSPVVILRQHGIVKIQAVE